MTATRKYMFDNAFDAAGAGARPAARRYSETEVEAARQEAFAKGREAGRAEAEAARDALIARSTAAVAEQLERIQSFTADLDNRMTHWALQAALLMVKTLFPELSRRHSRAEIEAMVVDTLHENEQEPRVVLRLPGEMIEAMQPAVADLCKTAGFAGRLLLIEDDTIAAGDCRIEWAEGGVERQAQRIWKEIEQRVSRQLAASSVPQQGPEATR
jgi:flagellar assembly protein FliH